MIYLQRNIYFYFKYIVVNLRVREVAMTLIDESSVYHASLTNTSRSSQLQKNLHNTYNSNVKCAPYFMARLPQSLVDMLPISKNRDTTKQ